MCVVFEELSKNISNTMGSFCFRTYWESLPREVFHGVSGIGES